MKKQRGITLIALIITVIIMLVLVAVSVNVIVKSNLIGTAEKSAKGYKTAKEQEEKLGSNPITINGKEYSSLDEYLAMIAGNSTDTVKWIYVENEDGNLEITGIDLSQVSDTENIGDYGEITITKTITLADDTLVVPGKINGKKVVKVSLTENTYNNTATIAGVKHLIYADEIEEINGDADVVFPDVETIQLPNALKNLEANSCGTFKKDVTITASNTIESIENGIGDAFTGQCILNFPDGINENLTIPNDKWGASKIIIEGKVWMAYELDSKELDWIYVENEDGNIEITGIDLTSITIYEGDYYSGYSIYVYMGADAITIPSKINNKNVVSFSLNDSIIGHTSGYGRWMSSDFNECDVIQLIFPNTLEQVGTFNFTQGNITLYFTNLESISFPDGKNENLVIPENKWGADTIIVEGFEEE